MKKSVKITLIAIILIIIALFLIRLISPREIDDVSPEINCPEIEKYNPDILYIIPFYNGKPISENAEWCNYILSLNKTLGLHGYYHTYNEFIKQNISQEKLELSISEFEKCFGYRPEIFKPPQLRINKKNRELIKSNNLRLKGKFSQTIHKVYHCDNTGIIENKAINLF